jgi:hypothetical protein
MGLTETGIRHIHRLNLNRAPLIEHRRENALANAERLAYQAALERIVELERELADVELEMVRLEVPSIEEDP